MKKPTKQSGQAMVFVYFFITVVIIGVLILYNSGQLTRQKMEVQNAADAAAYSAALLSARYMNYAAYTNRAMVANEVAIGQFSAFNTWGQRFQQAANGSALALVLLRSITFTSGFSAGIQSFFKVLDTIYSAISLPIRKFIGKGLAKASVLTNTILGMSQQLVRFATLEQQGGLVRDVINDNAEGATLSNFGALATLLSQIEMAINFANYGGASNIREKACKAVGGLSTLGVTSRNAKAQTSGNPEFYCDDGNHARHFTALVNDQRDEWLRDRRSTQAGSRTKGNLGIDIKFRHATILETLSLKTGMDVNGEINIGVGNNGGSGMRFVEVNPLEYIRDLTQRNFTTRHTGDIGWSHLDTVRLGLDQAPGLTGDFYLFGAKASIDFGQFLLDVGIDLSQFLQIPLGGASDEMAGDESLAGLATGPLAFKSDLAGNKLFPWANKAGTGPPVLGTQPIHLLKWADAGMFDFYGDAWGLNPILQPISAFEAITAGYVGGPKPGDPPPPPKKPKKDKDGNDIVEPPKLPTERNPNYRFPHFTSISGNSYAAHLLNEQGDPLKGPAFIVGVRKNIDKLRTSERTITNPKESVGTPSNSSNRFHVATIGSGGTGTLEKSLVQPVSEFANKVTKEFVEETFESIQPQSLKIIPNPVENAMERIIDQISDKVSPAIGNVIGKLAEAILSQIEEDGSGKKAIYALASARIFYKNPGNSSADRNDPGNSFSPYWEARLVPVADGVKKWSIKATNPGLLSQLSSKLSIRSTASRDELNESGVKHYEQFLGVVADIPAR